MFTDASNSLTIGSWCTILEDKQAELSAEDVVRMDMPDGKGERVPNHGVSRSAFWHRFVIRNGSEKGGLTLSLPYAEIDRIDLYRIVEGAPVRIGLTGRAVPWTERSVLDHEYFFSLELAPGEAGEYLLRTHGFRAIHVPLVLSSEQVFAKVRARRNLIIGGFAGIMLVMALYNLFVYLSIKDRTYLYYVLYILAICGAQLTLMGAGPVEMVHGDTWIGARASVLFALVSVLFGITFARRFMGSREISPRVDRISHVFFILVIIDLAVLFLVDPWIGYEFAQGITGLSAIYLLTLSVIAIRNGSRQARFFLIAWTAFLLGVVVFILKDSGVLPFNDLTQFAMPMGAAVESVLLSFGLADRINVLRREKQRSQALALEASLENERIIREQNVMLEQKVDERTRELRESNEHLKKTQAKLVSAEKLASLGQLTAGIAHEINNPINFITSNIGPLRRNIGEIVQMMEGYRNMDPGSADTRLPELKEMETRLGISESIEELSDIMDSIAEGSNRTAEIVRGLRNFSRLDESDLKECDINEGIRSTLTVLGPNYRDRVSFDLKLADIPKVECFPGKVNQVLMNVITNAAQATLARTDQGPRNVGIFTSDTPEGVMIRIKDNGIGMTDEVRSRMYDPFFTTKAIGEGTGLGLAIVYGIIEEHQGRIDVESELGNGSEFRITLPHRHSRASEKRA